MHILGVGKGEDKFLLGTLNEENFPGVELFGGNCILEEFSRIPERNFFIFLALSLLTKFYKWRF